MRTRLENTLHIRCMCCQMLAEICIGYQVFCDMMQYQIPEERCPELNSNGESVSKFLTTKPILSILIKNFPCENKQGASTLRS
jgi:hypothetical protein